MSLSNVEQYSLGRSIEADAVGLTPDIKFLSLNEDEIYYEAAIRFGDEIERISAADSMLIKQDSLANRKRIQEGYTRMMVRIPGIENVDTSILTPAQKAEYLAQPDVELLGFCTAAPLLGELTLEGLLMANMQNSDHILAKIKSEVADLQSKNGYVFSKALELASKDRALPSVNMEHTRRFLDSMFQFSTTYMDPRFRGMGIMPFMFIEQTQYREKVRQERYPDVPQNHFFATFDPTNRSIMPSFDAIGLEEITAGEQEAHYNLAGPFLQLCPLEGGKDLGINNASGEFPFYTRKLVNGEFDPYSFNGRKSIAAKRAFMSELQRALYLDFGGNKSSVTNMLNTLITMRREAYKGVKGVHAVKRLPTDSSGNRDATDMGTRNLLSA